MIPEASLELDDKIVKSESEKQSISLHNPGVPQALAARIKEELEDHTANLYYEGFRWHLGASVIGDECKRKLWYIFRWCGVERPAGRMQRLFNRGHLEESRNVEWLRGMGFTVWTHDDNAPLKTDGTKPQFRIKNKVGGHLGGSLDGIVQFPARYNIAEFAILETKTSGTGSGFNKVRDEALVLAKPEHYTQNSIYGYGYGIEHVLYMCTNKNDDDIAIKVEKLDFQLAQNMEVKAHAIIFSPEPPPRISENPTFFKCKNLCQFTQICHYNKPVARNCRSCIKCAAVDNAEFFCAQWQAIIPREEVPKGCPQYVSIVDPNELGTTGYSEPSVYESIVHIVKNDFEIEDVPLPTALCSICKEPQFNSPSGVTCKNGHGGAEPS